MSITIKAAGGDLDHARGRETPTIDAAVEINYLIRRNASGPLPLANCSAAHEDNSMIKDLR